jgi:hypothetical protein
MIFFARKGEKHALRQFFVQSGRRIHETLHKRSFKFLQINVSDEFAGRGVSGYVSNWANALPAPGYAGNASPALASATVCRSLKAAAENFPMVSWNSW